MKPKLTMEIGPWVERITHYGLPDDPYNRIVDVFDWSEPGTLGIRRMVFMRATLGSIQVRAHFSNRPGGL